VSFSTVMTDIKQVSMVIWNNCTCLCTSCGL